VTRLVIADVSCGSWLLLLDVLRGMAFDKVNSVGVDDAVVTATDSEVVGDQDDGSFGRGCHPGLSRASRERTSSSPMPFVSRILVLLLVVSSWLHCFFNWCVVGSDLLVLW